MANVQVVRYHDKDDSDQLDEYEEIKCIMALGTEKSEGIAYVSFGNPVILAIEDGFKVEVNDDYLDVKPIKE